MRRHWEQGDQQRSKSRNLSSRWLAKTNTARTGMGRTAGLRWLCRGQARMTQWRVASHLTEIDPFSFFLLMYTVPWYHKKISSEAGWWGGDVSGEWSVCDYVIYAAHKMRYPFGGTWFCPLFGVHSTEAEVGTVTLCCGTNEIIIGHRFLTNSLYWNKI